MKMTIEMSPVAGCSVSACAYNLDRLCHAKAITVGDAVAPGCDTFVEAPAHARTVQIRAGVGACKMSECAYNADLECTAERIEVGLDGADARCLTFSGARA